MTNLVLINPAVLSRKLQLRGKSWSALRAAVSNDTLSKIKRGEPVAPRILEKINVQLTKWPELVYGADLLTVTP